MHKTSIPTLVALLLAAAPAPAAVLLATDFTGVAANDTAAPYVATGISWTTSGLTLESADLTFAGPTGPNGFITGGTAADNIQVNRNIETAGPWSTTLTITPAAELDLANFTLFYRAINGGGANQVAQKDALVTLTLFLGSGTGGTNLGSFSDLVVDPGGGTAAGDTADVGLGTLGNLAAGQAYTFQLTTAENTDTGGNNWAIDDLVLNGSAVPEPGSALLGALGALALLRRRR